MKDNSSLTQYFYWQDCSTSQASSLNEAENFVANPSSSIASLQNSERKDQVCAVCEEPGAKMHYGTWSCLGCKGFFRRSLKKANEYICSENVNCIINRNQRNSCRYCRLQKCLKAGMNPAAVRPDRDLTGKQKNNNRLFELLNNTKISAKKNLIENGPGVTKAVKSKFSYKPVAMNKNSIENIKHLPVETRTMLMTLLNTEAQIVRGDTEKAALAIYPLRINSIHEIIGEPSRLRGLRTEMRYEPYKMAKNEELSAIVYRRLIAAIDWVDILSNMMEGGLSMEDKIVLVKHGFGSLALFKASARTAIVTKSEDILCMCNFSYVPRNIANAYTDTYHLDNGLLDSLINNLVIPLRQLQISEEEMVCMSAIIILNPMAKDLSEDGIAKVEHLRNRIIETLYYFVKHYRSGISASSNFGNLLLYLPIVTACANAMCENLRFALTFSSQGRIPLLTNLFGCFPVEPLQEMITMTQITELNSEDEIENEMIEHPALTNNLKLDSTTINSCQFPANF